MSFTPKSRTLAHLLAVLLTLPLLCACSSSSSDELAATPIPDTPTSPDYYINLSIVVSSGNEGTMRAPSGGENGDGREPGLSRENAVTGITLLLYEYEEEDGINMPSTSETKFAFVKYYKVNGPEPGTGDIEAVYTTGNQPLKNSGLELNRTYHAIVVANCDLTGNVTTETKVVNFREEVASTIYSGSGIGIDAANFVMASERNFDFTLQNPKSETIDGKPALVYTLDDAIVIERLAARVDFWMTRATYSENYHGHQGYVYDVDGCKDKFVLTAVTPFNLYNDTEYLIKRINEGGQIKYLGRESNISNSYDKYVIDPKTVDKLMSGTTPPHDFYDNPLSNFSTTANAYRQTTEMLHDNKLDEQKSQYAEFENIGNGIDNFILCYPKENTLMLASPLYYFATGVAIEGYYYKEGEAEGTPYTYFGFLRHQGEKDSGFYAIKAQKDLTPEDVGSQTTAMNFGVVRNNIYRISIESITKKGEIKLQIKVKKWDTFTHETIYM